MTRVNLGIKPEELCDKHLVAEHCEILMIAYFAWQHVKSKSSKMLPADFTLGRGHIKFFVPYGQSLYERWHAVRNEMQFRGFKAEAAWRPFPAQYIQGRWQNHHEKAGRVLLQERIIAQMPPNARWTNRTRPSWAA